MASFITEDVIKKISHDSQSEAVDADADEDDDGRLLQSMTDCGSGWSSVSSFQLLKKMKRQVRVAFFVH